MIVNLLSMLIGVLGLGFAFYQHRQRTRMESVVKDTLRRLAGDIRVIYSNATGRTSTFAALGVCLLKPIRI